MLRTTLITVLAILASAAVFAAEPSQPTTETASYIVQADHYAVAKSAVVGVGGSITHELRIINAGGASLSVTQAGELSKDSRLKIQKDRSAGVANATLLSSFDASNDNDAKAGKGPTTYMSYLVGASDLHRKGIIGQGIT
ncbi:MAG: hypothetical protein WBM76_14710, partial [Woeseiaceae bacterium]